MKLFNRLPVKEKIASQGHCVESSTDEYRALATELGIAVMPPVVTIDTFRAQLSEKGYECYPMDTVRAYMDKNCFNNYNSWGWIPLRTSDRQKGFSRDFLRNRSATEIVRSFRTQYHCGFDMVQSERVYDKEVPLPVLFKIKDVLADFPEAIFYVSDTWKARQEVEHVWRDPFLAVTLPGVKDFVVIERWDEPGFRL